jgi:hypothetical protein
VAGLAFSCNKNTSPYAIIVSPEGTESKLEFMPEIITESSLMTEEFEHLDKAIEFWNKSLGVNLFQYGGDKHPIYFNFVSKIDIFSGGKRADAFAVPLPDRCIITITKRKPSSSYDPISTLQHELGHCLGFDHSTNPDSIMYYVVDTTQHVTTEMIALMYPISDPS